MYKIIEGPKVTWVDIQNPDQGDLDYLKKNFAFHPVVFEQLLPPSWTTKVEEFDSHIFLVVFFPVYNKQRKETRPRELDLIVTKEVLITSHYNSIIPLKKLFDSCNLYEESRKSYMEEGPGFLLYALLHEMWEDCSLKVTKIDTKLTGIEELIFQGKEREMLPEIALAKTDIINFWRIVRPQRGVFTSLRDLSPHFFGEKFAPYFSHLRNHWARIMSHLIVAKEAVESLEQTNNALLTDKTNEIVKVLTIFSVIVFPLTLLAAIFGMNTRDLPLTGYPGDFWVISGIMAGGIFGMIWFFRHKKWL